MLVKGINIKKVQRPKNIEYQQVQIDDKNNNEEITIQNYTNELAKSIQSLNQKNMTIKGDKILANEAAKEEDDSDTKEQADKLSPEQQLAE